MRTETDIKNSGQAEITDKRLMQQLKKEELDRKNTLIYSHDTRRSRLGVIMLIRIYTPNRQSYLDHRSGDNNYGHRLPKYNKIEF